MLFAKNCKIKINNRGKLKNKMSEEKIPKELLEEYYNAKVELIKISKREETLKNMIRRLMEDNDIKNINNDKMELIYREVERINYPKSKIEQFVPDEIKEKIKTIIKTSFLVAKIK